MNSSLKTDQFQPTLPMRGATSIFVATGTPILRFQPTLPMRGATIKGRQQVNIAIISTHTPHAGSDRSNERLFKFGPDFNPHSPCGERPSLWIANVSTRPFQPTLPMRGATFTSSSFVTSNLFQPTLPMRGATANLLGRCPGRQISTHTPHAGSDI